MITQIHNLQSFDLTYEELKLISVIGDVIAIYRFDLTYEELKPPTVANPVNNATVLILPMRN